jgi:hypothetical protein
MPHVRLQITNRTRVLSINNLLWQIASWDQRGREFSPTWLGPAQLVQIFAMLFFMHGCDFNPSPLGLNLVSCMLCEIASLLSLWERSDFGDAVSELDFSSAPVTFLSNTRSG